MNGEKPLTVTAITQQIKPDIYPKVDDEATILLTYPTTQAVNCLPYSQDVRAYYRADSFDNTIF